MQCLDSATGTHKHTHTHKTSVSSLFIIVYIFDRVPVEITRLKLLTDGYFTITHIQHRHTNTVDGTTPATHTHTHLQI